MTSIASPAPPALRAQSPTASRTPNAEASPTPAPVSPTRPAASPTQADSAPWADRLIRGATALVVCAVAGIAAVISYRHARELAEANGEIGLAAILGPLTVDGLIFAASMVILDAKRRDQPVPLLAALSLGTGIVATIAANVSHGWQHGVVGALVSAWPAVALVGAYELLMMLIRSAAQSDSPAGGRSDSVESDSGSVESDSGSDSTESDSGELSRTRVSRTAKSRTAKSRTRRNSPTRGPESDSTGPVDADLLERARRYDAEKYARTGRRITRDELRNKIGGATKRAATIHNIIRRQEPVKEGISQ